MKRVPNICKWWQRHLWTKWEPHDGFVSNKVTGAQRDALVQIRTCTHCGYNQIEGVHGR